MWALIAGLCVAAAAAIAALLTGDFSDTHTAVMRLQTAHTADLDPATLAAGRALLDEVFAGELTDSDWEHALGGVHALAWEDDGELAGHASVIQRRLHLQRTSAARRVRRGRGSPRGARRRGYGAAMMGALEHVIRGAYDLGALGSTDEAVALYERRGWRRWEGPLFALTPPAASGRRDEEGAVYVLGDTLDRTAELTCDWRDGDVW